MVGDPEEEDDPDDATVGGAGPGDGVVETGMMAAGPESSAHRGGHHRIHGHQAHREGRQAEDAARGSAQVGGEEEESQLAGGFSANAVQDADEEDRLSV